jgi:Anti-sigma-K factor rskA, C-terminal/Putative zinc-finger
LNDRDRSHDAIEELAGAAALRALTPDEARFVGEHLAGCPRCRAHYQELAEAANLLLRAPEPIEPPPNLRARIMAEIALTPQDGPTSIAVAEPLTAMPEVEVAEPVPLARRRRFGWRDWAMFGSIAAALYFGFWSLRLQNDVALMSTRLAQQQAFVHAAATGRVARLNGTPAAPQVSGVVAETPQAALVYLENLPEPTADRAYQVWLIPPGGQPIGAGVSAPGSGGAQVIPLDRPLTNIQTVAVTQEPAGGSPAPTSAVLAAGQL